MIQLLLLSGAAVALMIWIYRHQFRRADDLGTLSAQWLLEYQREMHQDG